MLYQIMGLRQTLYVSIIKFWVYNLKLLEAAYHILELQHIVFAHKI